jgi:hypothetical protein
VAVVLFSRGAQHPVTSTTVPILRGFVIALATAVTITTAVASTSVSAILIPAIGDEHLT